MSRRLDLSEPFDPFHFWVKVFLIVLNLMIFAPYIFWLAYLFIPDMLTFWITPLSEVVP